MASYIFQVEHFVSSRLSQFEFFQDHFNDPISSKITTVAVLGLFFIFTYKVLFDIGLYFKLWDEDPVNKEFFQDKLVHCAHVYIDGKVERNDIKTESKDGNQFNESVSYHIEFGPEEYDEEDPELGTTLGFLKKKLYFLFKESHLFQAHDGLVEDYDLNKHFKIENVTIWKKDRKLVGDDTPLCKLGVETGDRVQAVFVIN